MVKALAPPRGCGMSVKIVGPSCSEDKCQRPVFKDGLCSPCWRLAGLTGRDRWSDDEYERRVPTLEEARALIGRRLEREFGDGG